MIRDGHVQPDFDKFEVLINSDILVPCSAMEIPKFALRFSHDEH